MLKRWMTENSSKPTTHRSRRRTARHSCNWLQHFENVVDPYHVPVLHGSFSGPQFTNMMASMRK